MYLLLVYRRELSEQFTGLIFLFKTKKHAVAFADLNIDLLTPDVVNQTLFLLVIETHYFH